MAVLGTYYPQAGFSFTRTYVAGIRFGFDDGSMSSDLGGGLYTALSPDLSTFVVVQVAPNIFAPTSNHYTLDHVIETSIYRSPPTSPTDHDLPFYLSYVIDADTGWTWLEYSPTNPAGPLKFDFQWPAPFSPWFHPPWS